jgi:glutathione S-transferase
MHQAMSEAIIHIGTRRYSSWSLRGWLAVRLADIAARDHVVPLAGGATAALAGLSPSGLVPCLEHDGLTIWDSLAIIEYCAEISPRIWPMAAAARARARSIAAEMHSGFQALRVAMPMNLGAEAPGRGQNPQSLADIARIEAIWADTRSQYGSDGPYLFGTAFTGADIMYAPVAARFISYAPKLTALSQDYILAIRQHPLIKQWYRLAADEPASWRVEKYEALS